MGDPYAGMSGNFAPDSVATYFRNAWQLCPEIRMAKKITGKITKKYVDNIVKQLTAAEKVFFEKVLNKTVSETQKAFEGETKTVALIGMECTQPAAGKRQLQLSLQYETVLGIGGANQVTIVNEGPTWIPQGGGTLGMGINNFTFENACCCGGK